MKKILSLSLLLGTTAILSACNGIPACNDELDECTYGGPYTEERTVQAGVRIPAPPPPPAPEPVVMPAPEPAPAPTPAPPPPPPPEPVPEIIQDVEIMRSAEPEFRQITK